MEFLHVEKENEVLSEWPLLHNGTYWDGTNLRKLVYEGKSPFRHLLDIDRLTRDLTNVVNSTFFDFIQVSGGANHYGFHIQFLNGTEVIARVSRGDCNDPKFFNSVREKLLKWNMAFEYSTYNALSPLAREIGHLLFHRQGIKHGPRDYTIHHGVTGRSLFVFQKVKGHKYDYPHWRALNYEKKRLLLNSFACLAGRIFHITLSLPYVSRWLLDRIFGQDHKLDLGKVEPTRDFCIRLFNARIHWILGQVKRERPDLETVCQSTECCLLQLVPRILPLEEVEIKECNKSDKDKEEEGDEHDKSRKGDEEEKDLKGEETGTGMREQNGGDDCEICEQRHKGYKVRGPLGKKSYKGDAFYRFVLDHGDYGIHNATIFQDQNKTPHVTSIFDWETGKIVPALLSEQKMIVTVDLILDQDGEAGIARWGDGDSEARMDEYMDWSQYYFGVLFNEAPSYGSVVTEGKEARVLWAALSYPRDNIGRWLRGLSQWAAGTKAKMDKDEAWVLLGHVEQG
ncbi:hypothetical protein CDD82_1539 [Ophiocordyceps australis]|uniref:Uncharacterized protein n=1 Tax=Ophiocordyceps australis TaxID=1399860 RepID=A0A2C5YRM6_9HYPO|nr:hypothetical protein CDD82_1539 [Ophiocordyceps australis]